MVGPGSWGPETYDADVADRLRRRRDLIHTRNRQLQDRVRDLAERRRRGPRPDEAERARAYADEARAHARAAHERAAACHEEAAAVHLRVAHTLELLGRRDRAQEHRVAAAVDQGNAAAEREAAEAVAHQGVPRDA